MRWSGAPARSTCAVAVTWRRRSWRARWCRRPPAPASARSSSAARCCIPPAAGAGVDPGALLGAILGGATFGDSISPVSDTTIASAGTQGADIGGTVRARLKYVLPAGRRGRRRGSGDRRHRRRWRGRRWSSAGSPRGLPMMLVPLVVIAMLLAERHLVEALLGGLLAAVVVALPLGLLAPGQLLRVETGSVTADERAHRRAGARRRGVDLHAVDGGTRRRPRRQRPARSACAARRGAARGPAGIELRIVAWLTAAVVLTTHSVVAILAVGPYASRRRRRGPASARIGAPTCST